MESYLIKQLERNRRANKRNRKIKEKVYKGKSSMVRGRQSYNLMMGVDSINER